MLPCLCLQIILGFTTAAWLLPLLEKGGGAQRAAMTTEGPSSSVQNRKGTGRSRREARDLTRLLHGAARLSKHLAAFLGQPGGRLCFRGGLSKTASESAFSDKLCLSLQWLLRKRDSFNISHSSAVKVTWLEIHPPLPCTAGELCAGMKTCALLKTAWGWRNSDQKAAGQREVHAGGCVWQPSAAGWALEVDLHGAAGVRAGWPCLPWAVAMQLGSIQGGGGCRGQTEIAGYVRHRMKHWTPGGASSSPAHWGDPPLLGELGWGSQMVLRQGSCLPERIEQGGGGAVK